MADNTIHACNSLLQANHIILYTSKYFIIPNIYRIFNFNTLLRKLFCKQEKPLNVPKLNLIISWCNSPLFLLLFFIFNLIILCSSLFFQFQSPKYSLLKIYFLVHHFKFLYCWLIPWIDLRKIRINFLLKMKINPVTKCYSILPYATILISHPIISFSRNLSPLSCYNPKFQTKIFNFLENITLNIFIKIYSIQTFSLLKNSNESFK